MARGSRKKRVRNPKPRVSHDIRIRNRNGTRSPVKFAATFCPDLCGHHSRCADSCRFPADIENRMVHYYVMHISGPISNIMRAQI